jgi:GNAT superfamily N-acetyltransferase
MTTNAEIYRIGAQDDIEAAARLSAANHARLVASRPFLRERGSGHYLPKLQWMTENGMLFGLRREGRLSAFLGAFRLEDFRNEGPGCFSPDWCHGSDGSPYAFSDYRSLYRHAARIWLDAGLPIHCVALHPSEPEAMEALSLTGFGRIVLDAAVPSAELADALPRRESPSGITLRRAGPEDARSLASMNGILAGHIGASPVFMPRTRGESESGWREWFDEPEAAAFIAEGDEGAVGYIKAQAPQFDVSDAVHGDDTLAINGMVVSPARRGAGIGRALLRMAGGHALSAGKALMSVDCETTNLEAYSFWTSFFKPVTWSYERRIALP